MKSDIFNNIPQHYLPEEIEQNVQKYWNDHQTFKAIENSNKKKYYCLSMLPYPSGNLHIGHIRNYTIGDVISRYQRMLGKNVLNPMGWDAFGLPAEEAAIKHSISPKLWTSSNIKYMKKQLKMFGFSYDWNREITTCDPQYYKWEQFFFIRLYEKGLAYKKNSIVNWCPNDKTVLANEQVINNRCWRCNSLIENKKIPQWFIKITNYADELLYDLDTLKEWPEQVKNMQRNWIGRSEGVEINFKIINSNKMITIYTERPDILMGVTYIITSKFHPMFFMKEIISSKLFSPNKKIELISFLESFDKIEKNKNLDTGLRVFHPVTNEILPIWITNHETMNETINIRMAVPGHNQHDWEFSKIYNIPMKTVILDSNKQKPNIQYQPMVGQGILFNSWFLDGLHSKKDLNVIVEKLISYNNRMCKKKVSYRLQDWCISRQRYWGVPIPMMLLKNSEIIPVPIDQLPVILPEITTQEFSSNPLKRKSSWAQITYNNQQVVRENDTFDTFMESSWYYARYTCPNYKDGIIDPVSANYWIPIDQYIGGIEHAVMHLMYFRFFHKLLRDDGLISSNEPVKRLLCQGMVLSNAFYYFDQRGQKIWISPLEADIKYDNNGSIIQATDKNNRKLIHAGMIKMSKSKKNGIDPQVLVKKYGADTVRLFIMFAAPVESKLEWNPLGIEGANRFLKRIWKLAYECCQKKEISILDENLLNEKQKMLRYDIHKTIKKVTDDIDRRQMFNTAIAAIMELTNKIISMKKYGNHNDALLKESLFIVIKLLYPFTPHISFTLWRALGGNGEIDSAQWPIADETIMIKNIDFIKIHINGRFRGKICVPKNSNEMLIYNYVVRDKILSKYLKGTTIQKKIYVPKKLLNIVTH